MLCAAMARSSTHESGRCQDEVDAAPVPNRHTGLDHTVDRA
jgi:hypothetical protein